MAVKGLIMNYPFEEQVKCLAERRSAKQAGGSTIVRGGLGLAAVALMLGFGACRSRDQAGSVGANQNVQQATALRVDGEARLFVPGRDSLPVAADEKTLDDLAAALASRDGKLESLIASGKVFTVPNNTRIRIMETGFAKTRVRVLEGDKMMQEGWVSERWLR